MIEVEERPAAAAEPKTPPPEPTGPVPSSAGTAIAELLLAGGLLTPEQLRYAQRVHAKLPSPKPLLQVMEELNYVTDEQIRKTLQANRVSLKLGDLLVELGYLSEADLKTALSIQKEKPGARLGEVLVDNHLISETELFSVLAYQLGYTHVPSSECVADKKLAKMAPTRVYKMHEFLPISTTDGSVLVAFANPLEPNHIAAAKRIFGENISFGLCSRKAIEAAVARLEQADAPAPAAGASENAIVAAAQSIIQDAIKERASDIHFEPMKDRLRIRMRRDGTLVPYKDIPLEMASSLTSRIKIIAGADIAERRRHQDGRILYETGNGAIDIRASFYVTIHGEKTVLRLLNNRETLLEIKDVGMAPRMLQRFVEDALDAPSGVVIITGPTGSGKTTTLYASVNHLNDAKTSIITAEDPVEYVIDGISQCSINPKISVSYEETLKHIVRQDPDIIVIGEIRDQFSAETAIQAALTGHKVLTTFHTEDSIGGLLRLLNMNIEAFLISSTVVSVVAQRLVRRVCPKCAEDRVLSPHELRRLGYEPRDIKGVSFKLGAGCPACRHLGYRGRVAIFELLVLNEPVKEAVLARKTSYEIRRISTETSGLVTLLEDGIVKAAQGLTSYEEIIHHLPRLAKPRPVAELRRLLGIAE